MIVPSLKEFSTVCCDLHRQSHGVINKAEVDVFLVFSYFFDDPVDVVNLISGSSAFSETSRTRWNRKADLELLQGDWEL